MEDYAIKALINSIDHLGSVVYKVDNVLDEKIGEPFSSSAPPSTSCSDEDLASSVIPF